jgi:hypothetical protein
VEIEKRGNTVSKYCDCTILARRVSQKEDEWAAISIACLQTVKYIFDLLKDPLTGPVASNAVLAPFEPDFGRDDYLVVFPEFRTGRLLATSSTVHDELDAQEMRFASRRGGLRDGEPRRTRTCNPLIKRPPKDN